jgi:hypothetical protein
MLYSGCMKNIMCRLNFYILCVDQKSSPKALFWCATPRQHNITISTFRNVELARLQWTQQKSSCMEIILTFMLKKNIATLLLVLGRKLWTVKHTIGGGGRSIPETTKYN